MKWKKIANWIIVSSVIAVLILAYLLVAVPKNDPQNLLQTPLAENSPPGDKIGAEDADKGVKDQPLSDSPVTDTEASDDTEGNNDETPEDEDEQDDNDDSDSQDDSDQSDDNDDQIGDDDEDESETDESESDDDNDDQDDDDQTEEDTTNENDDQRSPPMKYGLYKDKHHDNANSRANEVRYTCNGLGVGNPLIAST